MLRVLFHSMVHLLTAICNLNGSKFHGHVAHFFIAIVLSLSRRQMYDTKALSLLKTISIVYNKEKSLSDLILKRGRAFYDRTGERIPIHSRDV